VLFLICAKLGRMLTVGTWLERLDEWIPFSLGAKWDNTGLLIGEREAKAEGVKVGLDLTAQLVAEAEEEEANVLIVHHPPLFPKVPILKLEPGHPVFEAIEAGMNVISLHSSFDRGDLEVGERVCRGLGLKARGRFMDEESRSCYKLQTFVPVYAVEKVREALFRAGAGRIGEYEACSFSVKGKGSFVGGETSHPAVGQAEVFQEVVEVRLEVLLAASLQDQVERALLSAHPYEEAARDYALVLPQRMVGVYKGVGYGVWGECELREEVFYERVRKLFGVPNFQVFGGVDFLKKVGFTPGSGAAFLEPAMEMGLDVFVTGELDYHRAKDAAARGLTVVVLGHAESECFFKPVVEEWLRQW
jgi:dinuclear metal center YbgI/SA1388 family protein